jgi:tripartite-type tricarboxylate transporter receptor subunit TctC
MSVVRLLVSASAALALTALSISTPASPALAQDFPDRTVRVVVPTSAGGSIDGIARVVAGKLSELWNRPVVVENRPGAGMRIGVETAAKAAPDGYTLLVVHNGAMALNPAFYPDLTYDPVMHFEPVSMMTSIPLVIMVNSAVPAKSVADLVDLARKNPGKLNHATGGPGGLIALELFKSLAKVDIVSVQYKGAAPSVAAVIGGQVEICMTDIASAQPGMQSDRVRTLAVTSRKRASRFPDLPTASESSLPGYENEVWIGMFAPAGTPKQVVERIEASVRQVLAMPDVRGKLEGMGMEMSSGTAEELRTTLASDIEKWRKLVKERNIKIGQ